MSEILQPGQHPDADQLNAFVEHSLPVHEQKVTLAHIASCADCRAIVYLADPGESTPPRAVNARKPWFTGWNLAWPAVAALACLAVLSVHLHNIGGGKHQDTSIATADVRPLPLPAASPASAVPAKPASVQGEVPQTMDALSSEPVGGKAMSNAVNIDGFAKRKRLNSPLESLNFAGVPRIVPGNAPTAAGQQAFRGMVSGTSFQAANRAPAAVSLASPTSGGSSTQTEVGPGDVASLRAGSASASAAAQNSPSSFAALHSLSQQYRAVLPAAAPPPAPASSSQTVAVADAVSMEPESKTSSTFVDSAAISSLGLGRSAKLQRQPALPSHLPVVSMISNARQELAIDTAGTLFRSEDAGVTWQSIPVQWTVRAVKVSLTPSIIQQKDAEDTSTVTTSSVAVAREVGGAHSANFELTTETKEIWVSSDGQTWKRK